MMIAIAVMMSIRTVVLRTLMVPLWSAVGLAGSRSEKDNRDRYEGCRYRPLGACEFGHGRSPFRCLCA